MEGRGCDDLKGSASKDKDRDVGLGMPSRGSASTPEEHNQNLKKRAAGVGCALHQSNNSRSIMHTCAECLCSQQKQGVVWGARCILTNLALVKCPADADTFDVAQEPYWLHPHTKAPPVNAPLSHGMAK